MDKIKLRKRRESASVTIMKSSIITSSSYHKSSKSKLADLYLTELGQKK